jgi:hypothetical protein
LQALISLPIRQTKGEIRFFLFLLLSEKKELYYTLSIDLGDKCMARYTWEESFNNDNEFEPENTNSSSDSFVICPAIFYQDLNREQFLAMQQIYQVAYEKARAKVKTTRHPKPHQNLDDYDFGGGI